MQKEVQLKLGFISLQELCDWFHIKRNTYYHTKKKRLEELKIFAEFEEVRGGLQITKVKIPIYAKKGFRAYNIIRDNFSDNSYLWAKIFQLFALKMNII